MSKKKKGMDINGWVIVDKPRDMGSTDVVTKLKRMFSANKVGHGGTLDPFATGLLPIAFGEATKLINMVMDGRKEYEFVLQFGASSTTDDSEGELMICDARHVSEDDIFGIIHEFVGEIMQVPPVYSAIKIDGKRAYDLARQGVEVEMKPREVEIFGLELLEMLDGNQAKFRVECSKGTYVRTLGKDIALRLGTLGYLKELRRTKNGVFGLGDAKMLEVMENMVYRGTQASEVLLPVSACLRDIAVIAVTEDDAAKLKQGQSVSPKKYSNVFGEAVVMFEEKLVAIVRIDERKIAPVRVFNI